MSEVKRDKLHPDFEGVLAEKPPSLQALYRRARLLVLDVYPDSNELLYHTHALSSVYSVSTKLKHAFCHIPVYSKHINLGFNAGTELDDPAKLLEGTGARIRHVPIARAEDLDHPALVPLIRQAVDHALASVGGAPLEKGLSISKIG